MADTLKGLNRMALINLSQGFFFVQWGDTQKPKLIKGRISKIKIKGQICKDKQKGETIINFPKIKKSNFLRITYSRAIIKGQKFQRIIQTGALIKGRIFKKYTFEPFKKKDFQEKTYLQGLIKGQILIL